MHQPPGFCNQIVTASALQNCWLHAGWQAIEANTSKRINHY